MKKNARDAAPTEKEFNQMQSAASTAKKKGACIGYSYEKEGAVNVSSLSKDEELGGARTQQITQSLEPQVEY